MSEQQPTESRVAEQITELRVRVDSLDAGHNRIREEVARERETRESDVGSLREAISAESQGRHTDYRSLMQHIQELETRFGSLESKINRMIWAVGLVGGTIAVIGAVTLWLIRVGNGVGVL